MIDDLHAFWRISFASIKIDLPLRSESMWLDWETAVSVTGHDIDIKAFYQKAVQSAEGSKLFFDVGANYGTQFLLLLAFEVEAVSFEPNPQCRSYFEVCLENNNLKGNWQP